MQEILLALFIVNVNAEAITKGYKIKTRKGKVYLAETALMKHKAEETTDYGSDYSLTSKMIKGMGRGGLIQ